MRRAFEETSMAQIICFSSESHTTLTSHIYHKKKYMERMSEMKGKYNFKLKKVLDAKAHVI